MKSWAQSEHDDQEYERPEGLACNLGHGADRSVDTILGSTCNEYIRGRYSHKLKIAVQTLLGQVPKRAGFDIISGVSTLAVMKGSWLATVISSDPEAPGRW
jgi:hypothetical protein